MGSTWWETPKRHHGVQTCYRLLGPQVGKSQRECDFLRELSGMAGSSKLKKKKCCGAVGTMEELQLEREHSVKAPWAHTYFPKGKMGNAQYNILAASIPSASQIQARLHHKVFGNYLGGSKGTETGSCSPSH